jgi:hypothetical protein
MTTRCTDTHYYATVNGGGVKLASGQATLNGPDGTTTEVICGRKEPREGQVHLRDLPTGTAIMVAGVFATVDQDRELGRKGRVGMDQAIGHLARSGRAGAALTLLGNLSQAGSDREGLYSSAGFTTPPIDDRDLLMGLIARNIHDTSAPVEYEPRPIWAADGQIVDIANTPYTELPEDLKRSNRAAANGAAEAYGQALEGLLGGPVPGDDDATLSRILEPMAETIYAQATGLEQLSDDPDGPPSYADLSEADKERYRDTARTYEQARRQVWARTPAFGDPPDQTKITETAAALMHDSWRETRRGDGFVAPTVIAVDDFVVDVANGEYASSPAEVRQALSNRLIDDMGGRFGMRSERVGSRWADS